MSKINLDITMSVDGFIAATGRTTEAPMGVDGDRLHTWTFAGTDEDRSVLESGIASVGAVICGRRTYDDSLKWWQENGPTGSVRLPVVVLTHEVPAEQLPNGVYHFEQSVDEAVSAAKRLASGRDIVVMGGASVLQQFLDRGLVDTLNLHVAPVLLGAGLRLFDAMDHHIGLVPVSTLATPFACHLRYDVEKSD